jgi:hypothetical protein
LLPQAAEVAFQQGDDLYMLGGHALAASMELHARIIMANDRKEEPPQGFKWCVLAAAAVSSGLLPCIHPVLCCCF